MDWMLHCRSVEVGRSMAFARRSCAGGRTVAKAVSRQSCADVSLTVAMAFAR